MGDVCLLNFLGYSSNIGGGGTGAAIQMRGPTVNSIVLVPGGGGGVSREDRERRNCSARQLSMK